MTLMLHQENTYGNEWLVQELYLVSLQNCYSHVLVWA